MPRHTTSSAQRLLGANASPRPARPHTNRRFIGFRHFLFWILATTWSDRFNDWRYRQIWIPESRLFGVMTRRLEGQPKKTIRWVWRSFRNVSVVPPNSPSSWRTKRRKFVVLMYVRTCSLRPTQLNKKAVIGPFLWEKLVLMAFHC